MVWFLALLILITSAPGEISSEDCPPLLFVSLKNGEITPSKQNGFKFSCDRGYYITGSREALCRSGKWNMARDPKCVRSGGYCDPPPPVENAKILGENYQVGSTVMYTCNPGYRMLGRATRTCEEYMAWSGRPPTCQAEEEPLQNVAVRLKKEFIENVGSYSNDSRARALDDESIRNGLELVILIDRSSSVDPRDFQLGIGFIKFLFREFGVNNGDNPVGTRAAVLTFGSDVDILFNLDNAEITDPQAANIELDTLKAEGGGTAMGLALRTVANAVVPLLRPEAKRALFLITDGVPTEGADVKPEDLASHLKRTHNFEIFAVGVGNDIDVNRLNSIASYPAYSHMFILKDYSQLDNMISIIKTLPGERPKPGPEKCGYIDESQEPAEYDRWPWLAAVYISFPLQEGEFGNSPFGMSLCAGTLICSRWVLTAASCFSEIKNRFIRLSLQEVFVAMGERNLLEQDKSQRNYYATNVQLHPEFDPLNPLENNLALIELNEPVPLEMTFRPICLPRTDSVKPLHLDFNAKAFIAGWGRPPRTTFNIGINSVSTNYTLQTKTIALAEEGECLRSMKVASLNNIFCAGVGESDCLGSIGSPIVAEHPETRIWHILGVLTAKSECRYSNGYSHFTELRAYVPWIDETTRNCRFLHEN